MSGLEQTVLVDLVPAGEAVDWEGVLVCVGVELAEPGGAPVGELRGELRPGQGDAGVGTSVPSLRLDNPTVIYLGNRERLIKISGIVKCAPYLVPSK